MKKILAMILALLLVLSMGVAMADGEHFTKSYKLAEGAEAATALSPIETFTFSTVTCTDVKHAAAGVTKDNAPVPTIGTAAYETAGGATSAGGTKDVTITLPTYNSVGIYTYTFNEVDNKTAGVTYHDEDITLVVTVQQNTEDLFEVVAVHCESPIQPVYIKDGKQVDADGNEITAIQKTDVFTNTYTAGQLTVKKQVTGNLADRDKKFKIKVTFTAPEGKTVKENQIMYTVNGETIHATPGTAVELELSHNDTAVTFVNIPDGVTYTVVEDSYASDGYDAPQYQLGENDPSTTSISDAITGVEKDDVVVINNKDVKVDTGITLDSLPYILVLALVAAGVIVMIARKRRANEE